MLLEVFGQAESARKTNRRWVAADGRPVLASEHTFPAHRTEFVVEVYGEPIAAIRHDRPVYDPTSARLKA